MGGWSPEIRKAEQFDISSNEWTTVEDYPFCTEGGIWAYAIVNRENSVLIFGGQCSLTGFSSRVVKYAFNDWNQIGNLHSYRDGLVAINMDDQIYIIGGRPGSL